MLALRNLSFNYPEKQLLQNIEFSLDAGCLLHLRGGNGSGKTTLIKLLAGLLEPERGDIYFRGNLIYNDLLVYQKQLCYVGHKLGVSRLLTIREHYWFELQRSPRAIGFDELVSVCALDGLEDVLCGLLSEGQRRRVALLRLLMSDASLWLLDEPLVGLDSNAIDRLMTLFQRHLTGGGCVVLSSHQALPCTFSGHQEYVL